MLEKLAGYGLVAHDGPRDALVEQRGVQQHAKIAALRHGVAAVYVHDVAQKLEGVERNAQRQREVFYEFGNLAEERRGKPRVFEKADERKVDCDGGREPASAAAIAVAHLDAYGDEPVGKAHAHQQQDVDRLAPCVEHERKYKQYRVLLPQAAAQQTGQQAQRQKGI